MTWNTTARLCYGAAIMFVPLILWFAVAAPSIGICLIMFSGALGWAFAGVLSRAVGRLQAEYGELEDDVRRAIVDIERLH